MSHGHLLLIYAVLVMVMMALAPGGLVGLARTLLARRRA